MMKQEKFAAVVVFPNRQDLMLKDLMRSGLASDDAKKMGCEALSHVETAHLTKRIKVPSYKIPYYDIAGKKLDFFRLRLLDDGKNFGRVEQRYWQKPTSLPLPYFAPSSKIKWSQIIADPKHAIILTEGEKKAYVACKAGLTCIGLGGVWSWRSKKHEITLLPELKSIKWEKREVFLAFDSDLARNTNVLYAARAFAQALIKQGAIVMQVKIPSGDNGENIGLDDWLLHNKPKKFWDLPRDSLAGDLESQMAIMNDELAYIEEHHTFYHILTNKFVSASVLRQHTYAHRNVLGFDEQGKPKMVGVFDEWSRWPGRRTAPRLVFAPGHAKVLDDGSLNTWSGWGAVPKKGSVKLWTQLLDYIFQGAQPEHRKWFEQWLAYPLQHPGTKLYSYTLLWSLEQRVGKSLIGVTMGRIYAKAYAQVSSMDIHSANNYWVVNKMFILAEEVTGSDKRQDADQTKHMITRDIVTVNIKYQPQYELPDYANYLFTSNHVDAFFLEKDQRGFIHEIVGQPLDRKFYIAYDKWFKSDEGIAALFDYLLKLDLRGFDPKGHAPITAAKIDMEDIARSDLDEFARSVFQDAAGILRVDGKLIQRSIWTFDELLAIFDPDGTRRTTRIAIGKALRRAGFKTYTVRVSTGAKRVCITSEKLRAEIASGVKLAPIHLAEIYEKEHQANSHDTGKVDKKKF